MEWRKEKKMEMTEIISLISNLGFPIVACGCMGYFIVKVMDKQSEKINMLTEAIITLTKTIEIGYRKDEKDEQIDN